ncbi:MAG TPA: hypothetical protein VF727_16160, partial [Allosphingosinicella sp.]
RNIELRDRTHVVMEVLIAVGDLALVPDIVRYHMFAHGIVAGTPARGGPVIFDRDETKNLLDRELPRYREVIESGAWLNGDQDADIIFAIEQGGCWTPELRQIAEDQLVTPETLGGFAALLIPPGWSVDRATIERFVAAERLRERLQENPPPADAWLAQCLDRLRRILDGEDPLRVA